LVLVVLVVLPVRLHVEQTVLILEFIVLHHHFLRYGLLLVVEAQLMRQVL
jgi:hypothetical protein